MGELKLPPFRRYLLFAWYEYEASGGWNDFVDSYDTLQEGVNAGRDQKTISGAPLDWHVFDITTGTLAYDNEGETN